jgi:DNA adenine methylase
MNDNSKIEIFPFLRWAGGKQWLASKILNKLDLTKENTYYEPFIGGGSLLFRLAPSKAVISDVNNQLIETYTVVRDNVFELISELDRYKNLESEYYSRRLELPSTKISRAARFIYLNKTCWNGLYRVNKQGIFNVPYGKHNRKIYDKENLILASQYLQDKTISCCDFAESVKNANKDDLIYIDPPYTVLHSKNGFRQYNEKLFSWDDQIRLAKVANELATKGCQVIISNASVGEIKDLYPNFSKVGLSRKCIIAGKPKGRIDTQEILLFSSQELMDQVIQ